MLQVLQVHALIVYTRGAGMRNTVRRYSTAASLAYASSKHQGDKREVHNIGRASGATIQAADPVRWLITIREVSGHGGELDRVLGWSCLTGGWRPSGGTLMMI